MNQSLKKIMIIVFVIIYIALLPWPLYVALPYMLFSGWMKTFAILIVFAIEFFLGIYLGVRRLKIMIETKKTGSKIVFGLVSVSFLIYAATSVIYLAQVLLSVI